MLLLPLPMKPNRSHVSHVIHLQSHDRVTGERDAEKLTPSSTLQNPLLAFFKMIECGGTSNVMPATAEIQAICDEVKASVEEKAGRKFELFKATTFTSQVVAGTNYFVKIEVDDGFVHVRIFKPLPYTGGNAEVHSIQDGKSKEDELVYF